MSTDIAQIQMQRFKDSESKRMNAEIKKQTDEHNKEYSKTVKNNEATIVDLRRDYDNKVDGLKNELEQKLIEMRRKHDELLSMEKTRMDQEITNLKAAHVDQVQEIKTANQGQIDEMNTSHRNTLENARQKFLKSKVKWES